MHLRFRETGDTGKTKIWSVDTQTGLVLGEIRWYGPWRRYCFFPSDGTLFDASCLIEITAFIHSHMEARRGSASATK